MNDDEGDYDDFRLDRLLLEAARHLLLQEESDSAVASTLHCDRHTIAKLRNRMVELGEVVGKDKQEQKEKVLCVS
ncbi:unnamed protein product, partial [marine sediment metagenome]